MALLDEAAQFARNVGGSGRPSSLEDLQRLPQPVFRLGEVAGRQGALAEASQRVCLIPGVGDLAGQVQRLPVA